MSVLAPIAFALHVLLRFHILFFMTSANELTPYKITQPAAKNGQVGLTNSLSVTVQAQRVGVQRTQHARVSLGENARHVEERNE